MRRSRLFHSSNRVVAGAMATALLWQTPEITGAMESFDDFQIHGFLSQGYLLTSENKLFGSSDTGGSFDYTEAGLNTSWTPNSDLRLAAQILFRRAGSGHEHDVELDFGILDYSFLSTATYRLGMRLGRFKVPYGFYNDTRDVIFTRPTILLPQSIYPDQTRDLSISADGGLIYGDYRDAWGNLALEFGVGIPRGETLDSELAVLGGDYPGKTHSKLSYVGRLGYELWDGKLRMAISSARVDTRYDPEFFSSDNLLAGKDIFKPLVFSMQYNQEKLSLTTEYAIRSVKDTDFGEKFDKDITGESYYLQAEYRFADDWVAIIRYDTLYNDRNDRNGNKFQTVTGYPAHIQFAKDWTFGLRYYVNPSFLIATEYHYINGTAWLPLQDNPDSRDLDQRWHLFALMAGFRF